MTDLRKAAEKVLQENKPHGEFLEALDELRQALAQPEQEPVAWVYNGILHEFDPSEFATSEVKPLYTAPPKREPLMTKYVIDLWDEYGLDPIKFAREIEAAHGIKEST